MSSISAHTASYNSLDGQLKNTSQTLLTLWHVNSGLACACACACACRSSSDPFLIALSSFSLPLHSTPCPKARVHYIAMLFGTRAMSIKWNQQVESQGAMEQYLIRLTHIRSDSAWAIMLCYLECSQVGESLPVISRSRICRVSGHWVTNLVIDTVQLCLSEFPPRQHRQMTVVSLLQLTYIASTDKRQYAQLPSAGCNAKQFFPFFNRQNTCVTLMTLITFTRPIHKKSQQF